jgi:hypothetical protein
VPGYTVPEHQGQYNQAPFYNRSYVLLVTLRMQCVYYDGFMRRTAVSAHLIAFSKRRSGAFPYIVPFTIIFMATSAAFAAADSACNTTQLPMTGTRIVNVSTESQLQSAMNNLQSGDTILIANGTYNLTRTLYINGKNNVTIRGSSGCDGVVLVGRGMDNASYGDVEFGIWSNSANTTVAHLTLRSYYDNEIILNPPASSPHIYSVKLIDAGSQFIKVNPLNPGPTTSGIDNGIMEYCWLEYLNGPPATDHGAGTGYFNGISAHNIHNWIIRANVFKNMHNPDSADYHWNPAVLLWNYSANTLTERNIFINVDRAIAYGLTQRSTGYDHQGGIIRNNFIYAQPGLFSASRKYDSDGAIIAWDSPYTKVYSNTLLTNGNFNYAIEFRFARTTQAEAMNNLADAGIHLRDGAGAAQGGNLLNATPAFFADPANADLHLKSTAVSAIGQGLTLSSVSDDIDGESRPYGSAFDIGADEWRPLAISPPTNLRIVN